MSIENLPTTSPERTVSFVDKYLEGLIQLAPIEEDPDSFAELAETDDIISPEQARSHLKTLGLDESDWTQVLNARQSHALRAEIITALSDRPRPRYLLDWNLRLLDQLDADVKKLLSPVDSISQDPAQQLPAIAARLLEHS